MASLQDVAGNKGLISDGDWILSENMSIRGTIGVIQLKHVGLGEFLNKDFNFISEETFKELGCNEVVPGDILISRMADPIGRACIVPKIPFRCVTVVDVTILRNDPDVADAYYVQHLCNSRFMRQQIERATRGTTRPRITRTELETIEIPLPPLPEQRRIAALLDKADHLRRTRRYAAQLSDTFLQAVFVRMFGDYIRTDSDARFQDVLAMPLQNGFFETNDKYGCGTPVVWVDNLYHTISIDTTNLRRVQTDGEAIKKYEVVEGDLLFTRSSLVREGVGQVNIVPELKERTMFESHIIRARANQKKVNPFFILELFRSNFGRTFIMRGAHTATMTTVQQDTIEELPCPLPPLALQQKFARVVQQFERLRAQQREAERQAEHLFQTLLHTAFSGEV